MFYYICQDSNFILFFFGNTKLSINDTTNTPATAFPLKISPTSFGNAAKKFPDVCVSPTPIQNAKDTITIVRSSNSHSFNILIPSYMIEPNIITVHPPSTACGRELKNAPSGGNNDAKLRSVLPLRL